MSYMELKTDENMEKALDAIGLLFCVSFFYLMDSHLENFLQEILLYLLVCGGKV